MYSEYKGNRPDAPEDLRPQFSLIQDVLKALGICVIEEEGFEGDDILGSLSKKFGALIWLFKLLQETAIIYSL